MGISTGDNVRALSARMVVGKISTQGILSLNDVKVRKKILGMSSIV